MKIKTKLSLGVGVLFLLILLLGGVSVWYIRVLSGDTQSILKANYNSLEYSRNMLVSLDEDAIGTTDFVKFADNLKKQKANITEAGEKDITDKLEKHFNKLKADPTNILLETELRRDLYEIINLNMHAIEAKGSSATKTSNTATVWVTITGFICLIIAFTFLLNLPSYIASPIRELTESIKQIAERNYSQRVHFHSKDEFGELADAFNVMAIKLEEYENSNLSNVLFEKKRIETLINNMPDPVLGLDEKKRILFANDKAQAIIGMKPGELIGKFAQDVAVYNDLVRSLIKELILPAKDKTVSVKPLLLKIYADNKESYFEKETMDIVITPTGEKQKRFIGNVIVLKNVTSFKELDFAKTNFIATVSHELKTPISSMKMSLQLLEKTATGNINPAQQELIESIKDDSDRLLKITGELLNMAQVETGNIQLNIQPSNPTEILQYALDTVKNAAENKQVKLNVQMDSNLPLVKADSEKVAWVLVNLLTNAIRYSPEKSEVLVEIKKIKHKVAFSVKDQGNGIDARYRHKVFDRYFQIPGSNKAGTGLGLAISKEFIEAQGGTINVESEIGYGSRFYFELSV